MSVVTVRHQLISADRVPVAGRTVTAELISPTPFLADHTGSIVVVGRVNTDLTGLFELQLTPQLEIAASGTHYQITVAGTDLLWHVVVPSSGPVQMDTILVDPDTLNPVPPAADSVYLPRAERNVPNGVAPLGSDGKVPAANLPEGSGGTTPDATTSSKGIVQLAGDLGGTAAAPTVPALSGKAATIHTHPTIDIVGFTAAVDARVQNIVGAAPAALDTLVELATALGNDASFAATVTAQLTALNAAVANRGLQATASSGLRTVTFTGDTSGAWTPCPAEYRVTVPAAIGDVLLWHPQLIVQVGGDAELDIASLVGGNPARYFSSGTSMQAPNGHGGLYIGVGWNSALKPIRWIVTADDLDGGNVTLALMRRAGTGVTFGSGLYPSQVDLTNLGTAA